MLERIAIKLYRCLQLEKRSVNFMVLYYCVCHLCDCWQYLHYFHLHSSNALRAYALQIHNNTIVSQYADKLKN